MDVVFVLVEDPVETTIDGERTEAGEFVFGCGHKCHSVGVCLVYGKVDVRAGKA